MRSPASDGSSVPTPPNAFSPAFLEQVQDEAEPLTASEAELSGPWKVERLAPEGGQPGAYAVVRLWESVAQGDRPAAVFLHRETAALFATLLPLVEREPLFSLEEEPAAEGPLLGGYPVTAMYGEQGPVVFGWLGLFRPETAAALHLFEGLVRSPWLLGTVADAAGSGALAQLGRLLPELVAARQKGQPVAGAGEAG